MVYACQHVHWGLPSDMSLSKDPHSAWRGPCSVAGSPPAWRGRGHPGPGPGDEWRHPSLLKQWHRRQKTRPGDTSLSRATGRERDAPNQGRAARHTSPHCGKTIVVVGQGGGSDGVSAEAKKRTPSTAGNNQRIGCSLGRRTRGYTHLAAGWTATLVRAYEVLVVIQWWCLWHFRITRFILKDPSKRNKEKLKIGSCIFV